MLAVQAKNLNVFVALLFGRFLFLYFDETIESLRDIKLLCFTSQGYALCATGHSGSDITRLNHVTVFRILFLI